MATRGELIASHLDVEEIREHVGADSLGYLSLGGLRRVGSALKHGFCDACFSDDYPVDVGEAGAQPQLSLFRTVGDDHD